MKTLVIHSENQTKIPFLRGILIRNLLDAGLNFADAYELAGRIRDDLDEVEEIASDDLQQRVAERLRDSHGEELAVSFLNPLSIPPKIQVRSLGGTVSAFSRGRHQRYLQSSAISASQAERITQMLFNELVASDISSITTCQLGYLTYLCLRQELGKGAGRRYLLWSEFQRSDRPLILLICGAVGTGKSSITTELSHQLEIIRTQSTDMLREVMRSMISPSLLPVLHRSSFDAWKALPIDDKDDRDRDQLVSDGYRAQAELLSLACEAVLHRASKESTAMILEGIHAHPNLLNRLPKDSDAIAVHATLAVMKPKELRRRLRGRSTSEPKRRVKRYLSKFDAIWSLQSCVLGEAERHETAIIVNDDIEMAIFQLTNIINHTLSSHFSGTPETVFGSVVPDTADQGVNDDWRRLIPVLLDTGDLKAHLRVTA